MAGGAGSGAGSAPVIQGGGGLRLIREGAAAIAVLERPQFANALSGEMQAALAEWYPSLARDPEVYAAIVRSGIDGLFSGDASARSFGQVQSDGIDRDDRRPTSPLALCWLAECFSKPTVTLIDGVAAGLGGALALYGTHRIAGERFRLMLGRRGRFGVPGFGLARLLAKLPHGIGNYIGLCGIALSRADAFALGLVTHCIAAKDFAGIETHLADADPVDPVLDDRHQDPGASPLIAAADRIERTFHRRTLAEIIETLEHPTTEDAEWAGETLRQMRTRPAMGLGLTFEAIERSASLDIREALLQDHRLDVHLQQFLGDATDEPGGAAAAGHAPPMAQEALDAFFARLGSNELALPSRADMQRPRK